MRQLVPPSSGRADRSHRLGIAAVALALVTLGGCGDNDDANGNDGNGPASSPSTADTVPTGTDPELAETSFALRVVPDVATGAVVSPQQLESHGVRRGVVDVISEGGGEILVGTGPADGPALRFPEYADGATGPAAVLRVLPAGTDWMNPGSSDLRFGVDVRLDEKSSGNVRDNGDNVLQRGLFSDEAQFKIQVDKHYPSCLVSGAEGRVTARVPVKLDPATWYRLVCTRSGDKVQLEVSTLTADGPAAPKSGEASGAIGSLNFLPTTPLSVGGKIGEDGVTPAAKTDQFNGTLDRVFVDVG